MVSEEDTIPPCFFSSHCCHNQPGHINTRLPVGKDQPVPHIRIHRMRPNLTAHIGTYALLIAMDVVLGNEEFQARGLTPGTPCTGLVQSRRGYACGTSLAVGETDGC